MCTVMLSTTRQNIKCLLYIGWFKIKLLKKECLPPSTYNILRLCDSKSSDFVKTGHIIGSLFARQKILLNKNIMPSALLTWPVLHVPLSSLKQLVVLLCAVQMDSYTEERLRNLLGSLLSSLILSLLRPLTVTPPLSMMSSSYR